MNYSYNVHFLKLLLLNLYIYSKILNITNIEKYKKVLVIIFSILISIPLTRTIHLYMVVYICSLILACIACKNNIWISISGMFMATGINLGIEIFFELVVSHIYYFFKLIFNFITTGLFTTGYTSMVYAYKADVAYDDLGFLHSVFTFVICTFFIHFLFKTKSLKKGFIFLKIKDANIIAVMISILIIFSRTSWDSMNMTYSYNKQNIVTAYFGVLTVCCVLTINFWFKYNTKIIYLLRIKDRTIDELQTELEKVCQDNNFLYDTLKIHNKIIPQMHNTLKDYLFTNDKHEFNNLDILMKARNKEVKRTFNNIPKTGIHRIDSIISYMHAKSLEIDITLDVVIATDINLLLQKHIAKQDFETLLADVLENAIIATSFSETKKILLTIGLVNSVFELSLQDSGIPFEAKTLYNLGIKRSSTHLDNGGTGIGYMKIFEILKEFKASFIIKETPCNIYKKSITVRFDGKNSYIIYSNRLDELKSLQKRDCTLIYYNF